MRPRSSPEQHQERAIAALPGGVYQFGWDSRQTRARRRSRRPPGPGSRNRALAACSPPGRPGAAGDSCRRSRRRPPGGRSPRRPGRAPDRKPGAPRAERTRTRVRRSEGAVATQPSRERQAAPWPRGRVRRPNRAVPDPARATRQTRPRRRSRPQEPYRPRGSARPGRRRTSPASPSSVRPGTPTGAEHLSAHGARAGRRSRAPEAPASRPRAVIASKVGRTSTRRSPSHLGHDDGRMGSDVAADQSHLNPPRLAAWSTIRGSEEPQAPHAVPSRCSRRTTNPSRSITVSPHTGHRVDSVSWPGTLPAYT